MKVKSTILLFLTALIWGFAFVAQRVGADYLSCTAYNGIRFTLGAVSLLPVIALFGREKMDKKRMRDTLFAAISGGLVLCIASNLQQWGIEISHSASKAGFITGLYIILVPIVSAFLFRRRTAVAVWIGAACAIGGLYLLSMTGAEPFSIGDILTIIGALFWTAHILIIDHFTAKNVHMLWFACGQFAICGLLNLIGAAATGALILASIQAAAIPLLYGGLMSVGVAYTLQILGQKDADPTAASIILSLESVFSCVGALLILHESMSISNYIGCILIFVGIILAQLPKRTNTDPTKTL